MDGTTTKEDVRIDKDDADELNREAAESWLIGLTRRATRPSI